MNIREKSRLDEEIVLKRINNKNVTLLNKYTTMRDMAKLKCNICNHEWEAKFASIASNKQGCPRCAGIYKTMKTINEDLKDKPFELIEEYQGSKHKHKFKCDCGNIFESTISNSYQKKRGCGDCIRDKFINNKELFEEKSYRKTRKFIALMKELGYENLDSYKSNNDILRVKCNKHNKIWETKPNYIINGHGRCSECINEEITKKRIIRQKERFEEKIKNDNFIKLIGEFKGFDCETEFKCLSCENEYTTKPVYYYYYNSRCPKCKASKGELAIMEYLDKRNINYKHEYSFEDFKGKKNRRYRFDFAILGKRNGVKALIEYDGVMHYKKKMKHQDLFECMERDNIKAQYAKSKKIKLIRIPYWDIDNIENILNKELEGVV